jgi:hypothetical protein
MQKPKPRKGRSKPKQKAVMLFEEAESRKPKQKAAMLFEEAESRKPKQKAAMLFEEAESRKPKRKCLKEQAGTAGSNAGWIR